LGAPELSGRPVRGTSEALRVASIIEIATGPIERAAAPA
jgi:hypothetical protein